MSSFIVGDSVINSIIELTQEFDFFDTLKQKLEILKFVDKSRFVDWEKYGQALMEMNYDAVNQRYNEKDKSQKFKLKKTEFEIYQKIKNLHCFNYQCSEGDVPETPLFKFVEELIHAVENGMITRTQIYEEAKWGTE